VKGAFDKVPPLSLGVSTLAFSILETIESKEGTLMKIKQGLR
jgi:hypothetical protein